MNSIKADILVVDDTITNLDLLEEMLSMEGYTVRPVPNGALAIQAATAVRPDLILLDINMPKMDGYEVCIHLKANPRTRDIPVIFLSALGDTLDKVKAFEVGGVDYVTKPFQIEEILARIDTHLELYRLQQSLEQRVEERTADLVRLNAANNRFVPHAFLQFLGRDSIVDLKLGDHVQRKMSILFSDIRDFTTMSEQMTPRETFDFLIDYMGHVTPIIHQRHGFVDKYVGDGVMALFPRNADDALRTAIDINKETAVYNQQRQADGQPPIRIGTGLHTGDLIMGILGNEERMQGTVISDAVNMASRLEGLTKLYGVSIIISEDMLHNLADSSQYHTRFLDRVQIKGKKKPIIVYEVFDNDLPEVIEGKLKTKVEFEAGLAFYCEQNFSKASASFKHALDQNPDDTAIQRYLQRTTHFMEHGVPPDWVGVAVLNEK